MSLIRIRWILCLVQAVLAVSIIFARLAAQAENQNRIMDSMQDIFAEAFVFESDLPGKGRVDVYVQVPYSQVNFTKEDDRYIGRFEISAAILTQEKQQVWQNSQLVELQLKDFSQTLTSRLSDFKQFSSDLPPGQYEIILQITDQETKKNTTLRKALAVKDFGKDSLNLSDLILAHKVVGSGVRKNIVPNLTGTFEKESGSIYLFFEIYNRAQLDSLHLVCKFTDSKINVAGIREMGKLLDGNRTQVIWRIDTLALAPGKYVISVEAAGYSRAVPVRALYSSVSRTCTFRIKGLPLSIEDVDKATEQLIYIAKESEIDFIRDAATPEEKLKRFLEFWAKHNPNPKSIRNELMEEYYYRVSYSNKNFMGFKEGWRTDRGMVFIRFGMPQNIDRHPFNSDEKPYEIWYYYDQNRQFVFVDDSGFGDYRLQYPETDLWGRIH